MRICCASCAADRSISFVGGLREPRLTGSVQETGLFPDPYVVAVRKGHRLARRKAVGVLDLADYDWVMPQRNVPRRAVIDSIFGQLPVKPPPSC